MNGDSLTAGRIDLFRHLARIVEEDIGYRDCRPLFRQLLCQAHADAASAPSYDGRFARDVSHSVPSIP